MKLEFYTALDYNSQSINHMQRKIFMKHESDILPPIGSTVYTEAGLGTIVKSIRIDYHNNEAEIFTDLGYNETE